MSNTKRSILEYRNTEKNKLNSAEKQFQKWGLWVVHVSVKH